MYADLAKIEERGKRKNEGGDDLTAQSMHIQIAAAMTKVGQSTSAHAQLFDRQLESAQEVLKDAKSPKPEELIDPGDPDA